MKPVWTGFWGRSRALGKVPLAPPVRCPTSKSSTSHRKVRRHIEKFEVTSKGLRRHVEKFDATSKSSMPRRKVRCLTSKRLDAILEYWSVRRFDGRFSPYARFRRLVSKPASAADVGTSNLIVCLLRCRTSCLLILKCPHGSILACWQFQKVPTR